MPMFPTFAVLVHGFAGSFHDNGSLDDGQSSPGSQPKKGVFKVGKLRCKHLSQIIIKSP